MNLDKRFVTAIVFFLFLPFAFAGGCLAATVSEDWGSVLRNSRTIVFSFCAITSIIVFSVLFYSTIYHRKSDAAVEPNFHKRIGVEILWTLLPIVMLVGMAMPSAMNVIRLDGFGHFAEQTYAVLIEGIAKDTAENDLKSL